MKRNIEYENIYVHYDAVDNMKILIKNKQAFYSLDNELFAHEESEPVEGLVSCKASVGGEKKATLLYRLVGNGIDLNKKYSPERVILSVPKFNLSSKERMSINYLKLMMIGERLFGKHNFSMKQSMMKVKKLSNLPESANIVDLRNFENQYNSIKLKLNHHDNLQKSKEGCITK